MDTTMRKLIIYYAAQGKEQQIDLLLSTHPEPNKVISSKACIYAIMWGRLEVVKVLSKYSPNTFKKKIRGQVWEKYSMAWVLLQSILDVKELKEIWSHGYAEDRDEIKSQFNSQPFYKKFYGNQAYKKEVWHNTDWQEVKINQLKIFHLLVTKNMAKVNAVGIDYNHKQQVMGAESMVDLAIKLAKKDANLEPLKTLLENGATTNKILYGPYENDGCEISSGGMGYLMWLTYLEEKDSAIAQEIVKLLIAYGVSTENEEKIHITEYITAKRAEWKKLSGFVQLKVIQQLLDKACTIRNEVTKKFQSNNNILLANVIKYVMDQVENEVNVSDSCLIEKESRIINKAIREKLSSIVQEDPTKFFDIPLEWREREVMQHEESLPIAALPLSPSNIDNHTEEIYVEILAAEANLEDIT